MQKSKTCGMLFTNQEGELKTCILASHGDPLHCDGQDSTGVDVCEEFVCDDPVADICYQRGILDRHGMPTMEFFLETEASW